MVIFMDAQIIQNVNIHIKHKARGTQHKLCCSHTSDSGATTSLACRGLGAIFFELVDKIIRTCVKYGRKINEQ
ncbi:MAG: hypothetical protein Ta2A_13170 [Treponemataceae bacterium]|nr:MAG: hypothetical protein Ta2A_13170 [Treponemataceae bacterium]